MYNIAYGERISLNALWASLQKTSGKNLDATFGPDRPGDVRDSLANIDKARKLIGYDPLFSVEEEVNRSMPTIPRRLSSIFKTTPSSISSGEAPG